MPYKSKAQQGFFHAAEERGEMSPKVVKEFDSASKGMKLPKRVAKKASGDRIKGYSSGGRIKMAKLGCK